jgi:hemin uptake protein HemP
VQNESNSGASSAQGAYAAAADGTSRPVPRIDAQDLLGSGRELIITLHESEYRLRLTSKGKLILTK